MASTVDPEFRRAAVRAGRLAYRRVKIDAVKAQEDHGEKVDYHWVGPLAVERLIHDFMRVDEDILAQMPGRVKFDLPLRKEAKNLEEHLYDTFAETVNRSGISPNLSFLLGANGTLKVAGGTPMIQHPEDTQGRNPDTILRDYRRVSSNESSVRRPTANKPPVLPRKPFDWSTGDLIVEFQKSSSMDPFYTELELKEMGATPRGANAEWVLFAKHQDSSARIRGQLAIYAKEIFDHQHRTHLFQLLICGRHARIIFWDRSGAIVSESFDYIEHPQTMVEFLWRYNHMTEAERGIDSTAALATLHEKEIFTAKVEQFIKDMNDPDHPQRKLPHAEDTLSPDYPVYKITVVDEISQLSEDVLVQRPFILDDSIFGRSTRGYVAYVISSEKLRFLKDAWRVVKDHLTPERTTYHTLEEADVPHVPRGVLGGDVPSDDNYSKTRCLAWSKMLDLSTICYKVKEDFHHHRILQDLAYPLTSASNSKEVVIAFRDCFKAIGVIRDKCRLLHRDISIGNVMLQGGKGGGGVLLDWDYALTLKPGEDEASWKGRTGTWSFLSIALLKTLDKAHDVLDDFESGFWSLLYTTLHYYDYELSGILPLDIDMFEELANIKRPNGSVFHAGGCGKRYSLQTLRLSGKFASEPLNVLVQWMARQFHEYYQADQDLSDSLFEEERAKEKTEEVPPECLFEKQPLGGPPCRSSRPMEFHEKEVVPSQVLREKVDAIRMRLKDSSTWLKEFNNVLSQEGWVDDALGCDRFPTKLKYEDAKEDIPELVNQMTFFKIGNLKELAAQDPQAAARLRQEQVQAATKIAEGAFAKCIKQAIMEYDDDDGAESCDCVEDNEERVGAMAKDVSQHAHLASTNTRTCTGTSTRKPPAPSRRAAKRSDKAPSTAQANASLPSRPSQKGGPSRLKRKIDEVDVVVGHNGQSSAPEQPPRKKSKSKSQSRAKIVPKKSKASSKKSVAKPRAVAKATSTTVEAEATKVTRTRGGARKPQSDVDKVVTQPRREGLRPRPTKPTKR